MLVGKYVTDRDDSVLMF